jgi:hypothetical protein
MTPEEADEAWCMPSPAKIEALMCGPLGHLPPAWNSPPSQKVNAMALHALGGAGKSALLRTFANELLASGGGGATRTYGWSAYSQGSGEQKVPTPTASSPRH